MALRGHCNVSLVSTAKTVIAHGLSKRVAGVGAVAVAPTEYWAVATTTADGVPYRQAAADSVNLYFAASSDSLSAEIFYAYPAAITL